MKNLIWALATLFFFTNYSYSQLYQGPAQGSVPSGVMVSTDGFSDSYEGTQLPDYIVLDKSNTYVPSLLPDYLNRVQSTGPEGTNFVFDKSTLNGESDSPSLLLRSFPGVPRTNFIPPDPSLAVGPTHVVGGVNSTFRIWDKLGNVIKTINGASWASSLGLSIGANLSDPKITYDHFAKRWIMVWITGPIGPFSYDVISVSDDSIPLGTWYNYALRSDLNGNNPSNIWRDYEGVGVDANAIYITGNGFQFSGGFAYSKIRIINKAELYANNGGAVTWNDLWDIRDPSNGANNFGIRPTVIYGNPAEFYFLCNSNSGGGSYVSLYKLINPLTSPSMTGVAIPVVSYSSPPNSSQLGSNNTITAGGTSGFRCENVFRDGFLYAVHPVRFNGSFSAFKYYKINVASNTADQDITYGADGFYYSYPAVAVDKNDNVMITYSRSALTEYIGAYYTTRLNTDPPNTFNPSSPLQVGRAPYVNTGSNDRWGDYTGAWVDPANGEDFWMMTEYADLSNNWGVWVGSARVSPYTSARLITDKDTVRFGNVEVNNNSDTQQVKIENFGNTVLTISSIQSSNPEFRVLNAPGLPVNINFGDSIILNLLYHPVSAGVKLDSIRFTSNDVTNPNKYVSVKGKGYIINSVALNTIYAVTGAQTTGTVLTINSTTGAGTVIGLSGFPQLNGLSIRPSTNQLYATITSSLATQLVRINATAGDAYNVPSIPIPSIRSLAFDINDLLYCATADGKIYKYNVTTFDTAFIGNAAIANLFGITINPINSSLWGISAAGVLYKINKQTGAAISVGSTGITPNTAIAFSKTGKLYGTAGLGTTLNKLISIDTSSGAGTLIGTNTGIAGINGLAISPEIVGIHNITTNIPEKYELQQNYPNPFNPTTTIKFALPSGSNVKLFVYDILGRELTVLVNEKLNAGTYEYKFDASQFSSGIYFYKLETDKFTSVKRMALVK